MPRPPQDGGGRFWPKKRAGRAIVEKATFRGEETFAHIDDGLTEGVTQSARLRVSSPLIRLDPDDQHGPAHPARR
jgi:hypothetical protein